MFPGMTTERAKRRPCDEPKQQMGGKSRCQKPSAVQEHVMHSGKQWFCIEHNSEGFGLFCTCTSLHRSLCDVTTAVLFCLQLPRVLN